MPSDCLIALLRSLSALLLDQYFLFVSIKPSIKLVWSSITYISNITYSVGFQCHKQIEADLTKKRLADLLSSFYFPTFHKRFCAPNLFVSFKFIKTIPQKSSINSPLENNRCHQLLFSFLNNVSFSLLKTPISCSWLLLVSSYQQSTCLLSRFDLLVIYAHVQKSSHSTQFDFVASFLHVR